jgi:CRISPR type III-A-associated RAMP protein Csm5
MQDKVKAMQGKNTTIKLGLEILTPTQTGTGANLFHEIDFINRRGEAFIVDQIQSFQAVASGNAAIDSLLASGSKLSDLAAMAGQDFGYTLPWLSSKQRLPEKIREQQKDAMNRPYLPGSSLKGAIRTALIAEWLRRVSEKTVEHLMPRKNRYGKSPARNWASQNLMQSLLGKDAKQDVFRQLKTRDTVFTQGDLALADIRWLNENRWRSMSKGKSFDDWKKADGIYAEILKPQAFSTATLIWDQFLLSDHRWQQTGTIANILPKSFEELREKLNDHAKYRLQREIEFFQQQKSQPKAECEKILALINNESDCAYVQLAWGSGWRGMTGDWASEEQVLKFRELFDLGKKGKPFPKTRRLVVSGEPRPPLGWIRLMPYERIKDKLEKQHQQQQAKANESAWVNRQLTQLAAKNHCSEQEALRGKALAEAWAALTDGEEKQHALADIKKRWQSAGWWDDPVGKAAKKAKKIYQPE